MKAAIPEFGTERRWELWIETKYNYEGIKAGKY